MAGAEPLVVTGAELVDEHIGLHLALSLPSFAQIDGEITAVRRADQLVGVWLSLRSHPFGLDIPVARHVAPDEHVELFPEPVQEVRRGD